MVAAFGGEVALLHSQLTPDERAEQWHRIRRGEARVVIGRGLRYSRCWKISASSSWMKSMTEVTSRKKPPRYHARDVAVAQRSCSGTVVSNGDAVAGVRHRAERGALQACATAGACGAGPMPR